MVYQIPFVFNVKQRNCNQNNRMEIQFKFAVKACNCYAVLTFNFMALCHLLHVECNVLREYADILSSTSCIAPDEKLKKKGGVCHFLNANVCEKDHFHEILLKRSQYLSSIR